MIPKWLRKSGSERSPELTAALADLDRLARDRPELAVPAGTLSAVLPAAFGQPAPEAARYAPDPGAVLAALAAGRPSFATLPPPLDEPAFTRRAEAVARALGRDHPAARTLATAIAQGQCDIGRWARGVLGADLEPNAPQDTALTAAVARLALMPVLAACSARLEPIRRRAWWQRADCPHCGEPALLAESRGLEGKRVLRCGLCAAEWAVQRVRCPACGESDSDRLGYRFFEGEEDRQRLYVCGSCGFRIAVVATLAPLTAPGILVAELAVIHLGWIDTPGGDVSVGRGS